VRGSVSYCHFENTKVPPAHWLFGGDYIAAIDMMALEDWTFSDNIFRNIKGRNGGGRAAIFIWVRSRRVVVERIDDCVITNPILNPADRAFSVLVWIKGGAPGQAVLSQMGGARWLCADPSEGNLMTELKVTGRGANELLSQTIITDGNWHRIALVWDGSSRMLYVDDVKVAKDSQAGLQDTVGGLYIGTGKAMEAGTYWSGLIDDVRIYNRAVTP